MSPKNVLLAMAGLGFAAEFVAAPAMARPGTAAGVSLVAAGVSAAGGAGQRMSAPVRGRNKAEAGVLALALAGAGAAAYGIYSVADGGSKSNGS